MEFMEEGDWRVRNDQKAFALLHCYELKYFDAPITKKLVESIDHT
jgi:hypothetical protein